MDKKLKGFISIFKKINVILTIEQKKWGVAVFILSVLGALAETLGVSVILPFVQALVEPDSLSEITVVAVFCEFFHLDMSANILLLVTILVVFVYIVKNLYLSFLSWVRVKYTSKVQRELSIMMLRSYMKRGYSFFRQTNTAFLLRGTTESVTAVYNVILSFMKILAEILTILCIFLFLLFTDWIMALCMVAVIGICMMIIISVFRMVMRKAGGMYYKYAGEVNRASLQLFNGIKEVLAFNRKEYFIDQYEKSYLKMQKGRISQSVAAEIPSYVIEGTCVTGIICALCLRINHIDDVEGFVSQLAVFAMAAFRLLPSIGRITANINTCMFSIPAISEVYNNVLEARAVEEKFKSCGEELLATDNDFRERIEMKNITWKYPDGNEFILKNISLTINRGEAVAFVGPSGAGKTTLADIILGLFRPQEGTILMDGVDMYKEKNIDEVIGYVPQMTYLLDDTIKRNVAFGIEEDKITDETVWRALEQAHLKEYVSQLPNKINTVIGERGMRFSGGQMQRLAIARALYKDPAIIVLDEATSALDNETESAVMESIDALHGNKTLIIIAHRLSTIKKCDRIYELSNGTMTEKRYEELNK